MKPSYLSLLIAAAAFGASTVYLARQLAEERTRAEQVLAESRELQARVAELEQARGMLAVPPVDAGLEASGASDPMIAVGAALLPDTRVGVESESTSPHAGRRVTTAPRPEQSEAFLRMLRGQLRAQNRHVHADIGESLGLTRDDANKLIDLLTDHHLDLMSGRMRNPQSDTAGAVDLQQKQINEITALIGYEKMERFRAYQESLPVRHEVTTIARLLEGVGLQLDDSQRKNLVAALIEERKRIPAPEYVRGTSPEDYTRTRNAWHADYQQRAESRVRSILSGEQVGAYDDYQQWSREMRVEFESQRVDHGGEAGDGNVMMAEPVAVAVPASAP